MSTTDRTRFEHFQIAQSVITSSAESLGCKGGVKAVNAGPGRVCGALTSAYVILRRGQRITRDGEKRECGVTNHVGAAGEDDGRAEARSTGTKAGSRECVIILGTLGTLGTLDTGTARVIG
jgi:hypothetical protein